ncbi:MAG: response regulator [Deltaproteobacteria bacterium]|nr:response regulator [Deltaproteobacteria bacterium]
MSERARILVVDDNAANRRLLKLTLGGGGYDLDVADSAAAALAAIAARRPALILLDLQLPDRDGLELARQLRRDPAGDDLIIVAVTSHSSAGHRELALAAGCDDYLTKPIDTRALPTLVAAILAARRHPDRPGKREGKGEDKDPHHG